MTRTHLLSASILLSSAGLACGPSDTGGDGRVDSVGDGIETADSNADNAEASDTNNSGDGDTGDGDTGDGDTGDGDTGDGDSGDGDSGDGDSGDGDSGDGGTKFDLGTIPDGGLPNCGGEGGEPEFSYLWAANSSEGTISKIDTNTVQEVGRYRVRPDGAGSPSRTSVSLTGHVAVASRSGGLTKFYATPEHCEDKNNNGQIDTSMNNQALSWDQEECRAWHTPFDYSSQRPVAWAPGDWNAATCEWENEMVWTAGRYGSTGAEVVLVDGETGMIVETVMIPGLKSDPYGIYGAAVDSEGNFWGTGWATGNHLVRVDIDTMEYTVWDGPSSTGLTSHWYGMTVDVDGYVWNCASRVARFDPMTEQWSVSDELGGWTAGCMADGVPAAEGGLLWLGSSGARGLNRETMQIVYNWPTPTSYGVSVDHAGFVWAVNGNGAHRVDPMTGTVTSYNGLVGAYTYSDMTGAALSAVGGTPSG